MSLTIGLLGPPDVRVDGRPLKVDTKKAIDFFDRHGNRTALRRGHGDGFQDMDLARLQPGMDRLMAEIAERARRLYYAATAGNWPAAAYFCRTLTKHLKESAFSRPKYAEAMATFLDVDYAPSAELAFICLLADDKRAVFFEWLPRANASAMAQCTRDDARRGGDGCACPPGRAPTQ